MMLLDIKQYIRERQTANLQEIAWHFKLTPDIARDMLQHWLRKGAIKRIDNPPGCGSDCMRCKPKYAEVYCFVTLYVTSSSSAKAGNPEK